MWRTALAKREERASRESVSDEQRSRAGCIVGQNDIGITFLALTAHTAASTGVVRSPSRSQIDPESRISPC